MKHPFDFSSGPQPATRARLGLPVSANNRRRSAKARKAAHNRPVLPDDLDDARMLSVGAWLILAGITALSGAVVLAFNL